MYSDIWAEILVELEKRRYKGRIVSVQHLTALQEEIDTQHRQGKLDEEVRKDLPPFEFQLPVTLPNSKALIVVAVPQPQIQVVFNRNGKTFPFIIPPTYFHHPNQEIETLLTGILAPRGYCIAGSLLPLKLLAMRCGLGGYGRNNICYIPEMGSFHRLMAFYSDLPCEVNHWQEAKIAEDCRDCDICRQSCPTSAISSKRFLLHAERCLTFHNEKPGEVPFPAWIKPSWHNSLVGCMTCQLVCPQNRDFIKWVEPWVEFSEEETAILLTKTPLDRLPVTLVKKLEQFDLTYIFDVFPRNLSVLLNP
jgi:epoxyqueuosine reductase